VNPGEPASEQGTSAKARTLLSLGAPLEPSWFEHMKS
jgi:hypothetical protein